MPNWRIIEPETPEQFVALYDLRWQLLRAPWNQPRGSERDEHDPEAVHALIVDDQGCSLGTGRLHAIDEMTGQIRYMAILPDHRNQGLGTALLHWLEQRARIAGLTQVILNAREHSVGFYEKRGYEVLGEGPVLFGTIRHRRMRKPLS